jgi:uncharacterized protein
MIHIEERHLTIVRSVLSRYPYTFYAFGSRAKGTQKKFSDLDLCFTENIPWNIRAHIDDDFEQSDLPFSVDIVDWQLCSEAFRAIIVKNFKIIQASKQLLNIEANFSAKCAYLPAKLGSIVPKYTNTLIYAMVHDLATPEGRGLDTPVHIIKVATPELLKQFTSMICLHDADTRLLYEKINDTNMYTNAPLNLFIAFDSHNNPVGIGSLFLTDTVAGIFDLMTTQQEDIQSIMIEYIMHYAKQLGYTEIALCASGNQAAHLYGKLGFKTISFFGPFEQKSL